VPKADRVRAGLNVRSGGKPIVLPSGLLALLTLTLSASGAHAASPVYRIDHVVDGDTVALRNGQRVRLVQIDTPEVFFGTECYGRAASRRSNSAWKEPESTRALPVELSRTICPCRSGPESVNGVR
jgi:endonuclease YncB( thermonuclease family)